jgi:hypothetical protein
MDINQKISPRPSFPKRGNTSLWQREGRRDFSIIVCIVMGILITPKTPLHPPLSKGKIMRSYSSSR